MQHAYKPITYFWNRKLNSQEANPDFDFVPFTHWKKWIDMWNNRKFVRTVLIQSRITKIRGIDAMPLFIATCRFRFVLS